MDQNHFNVETTELIELKKFKKSEELCIVGNGPSAEYIASDLKRVLKNSDIVGFSLSLFSNLDLTYYFHEPIYLVPHNPPTYKNSFEHTYYLVLYYLLREMSDILDASNQVAAISNPHFPKDSFGYWNMPKRKLLLPPYYFINECDDSTIVHELKKYVAKAPMNMLLNFRGSLIRAISLGYLLGYKKIIIAGYDPSSPDCWYTNQNSALFGKNLSNVLKKDINNLSMSRTRSRHKFDDRDCFFDLPRSVMYAIRVLDSMFKGKGMSIPQISLITTCKETKNLLVESQLLNRLEHFYDFSFK